MSQAGYIALAIGIIVVLAVIAIVTFILYRKTPAPKGCENLEPDEGICCACLKSGCPYYAQYHDKTAAPSAKGPDAGKVEVKADTKTPEKKEEEKK
jgi:hypothetical protein